MQASPRAGWEPWRPGRRPALPGLAAVIGHRGAAAHAPENTLASIRSAQRLGASWVEFDVKLTRDVEPVLMHDETVDRTTNGKGAVAELDLATLLGLDAGSRFGAAFSGEPIPTLAEAVDLLLELELGANVEIKPCPGREALTAERTVGLLLERWPANGPPLLVSSFSVPALRAARAAAPGLPLGLLVERIPRNWARIMQELGCTTLHPWHLPTRTVTIRALAEDGVPLLFYTVNDAARAAKLLGAGAVSIITDAPDRILPVAT